MKLLILSDSHKNMNYMCAAVEREQPDRIIHLGDHEQDAMRLARRYPQIPMLSVCGNCDFGTSPERVVEELEGVRLYITHGHTLRVKYGLLRAELAAREENCSILLFGHTHQSLFDCYNGLWICNPGSCSGKGPVTYAVIELSDGQVHGKICDFRQQAWEGLEELL